MAYLTPWALVSAPSGGLVTRGLVIQTEGALFFTRAQDSLRPTYASGARYLTPRLRPRAEETASYELAPGQIAACV